MKLQMISVNSAKKKINGRMIAIMIAALFALPAVGFSQEAEDEQQVDETEVPAGAGPWHNSAGSVVGTRENATTVTSGTSGSTANRPTTAADPRLGPRGGSLNRGAVGDGRDPGGNPDVPFDENMTLVFLAGAVVFAYSVARKKLRPAAVKS